MHSVILLIAVLLPIIGGALNFALPFKKRWQREVYLETVVVLTSLLVFIAIGEYRQCVVSGLSADRFFIVQFSKDLAISLGLDGLGCVFAGLVAALWPLATLYAFEYMKHEEREISFFAFYVGTFGVTLGIAFADNMLSMYCFYEMLTLITTPLVFHSRTREAVLASRTYMYYSLGGAAFAFIGMIFLFVYGNTTGFVLGGVLRGVVLEEHRNLLLLVYVLTFFGFSVKAALCPFNSWLPKAGVAPTPVTALLHAVAVVKAGAFATIRLTYYSFGADFVRGSWAQYLLMAVVIFTVVFGCSVAVKETHFKRRLAYSTISNLSYILFGVVIMTPMGMAAALMHMIAHAVMKICSFFCAGAVITQSEKHYVHELDGLGKKMPKVFGIFTVSSLALMGVPGLCGFMSKFRLAEAAVNSGNPLSYVGIGALLISALLTAIYMLSVVMRAFFPSPKAVQTAEGSETEAEEAEENKHGHKEVCDPGWQMLMPLFIFVAAMLVLGVRSDLVFGLFTDISQGRF